MSNTTQTKRVIDYLTSGKNLTEGQARARFGVKNMSAMVSNLRTQHGIAVYRNTKISSKGGKMTLFSAGKPTRAVVAAGYAALADLPGFDAGIGRFTE